MTKREFIQQAAIHIGAALVKSYTRVIGCYLSDREVRERIPKETARIVSHLAGEVEKKAPWDLDFDDMNIDAEMSMEDSV